MPVTSIDTATLNGSYELQHFTVQKSIVPPLKGTTITAKFDDGKLSGNGSINTYHASYSTDKKIPPSTISGGEIAATKMGGPPEVMAQEARYFDGLRAATTISYEGGAMSLSWENGQKSLVFRRV